MRTEQPAVVRDLFLTSTGERPPLRVGLVLDGFDLPRWQRSVLEQLQACDFAEVAHLLIVENRLRPEDPDRSWRTLLLRQYIRLDRRFYGKRRTPAPDQVVDCRDLLEPVARTTLVAAEPGPRRLSPEELDRLRGQDLDVLIDLGIGGLDGAILAAPRHGVWRCHHGPGPDAGAGHAGFRELASFDAVTCVSLHRLTGSRATEVLAHATTSTVTGVSWTLNRFEPLWLGAELIQQALHRLHQHGPEALEQTARGEADPGAGATSELPTNAEMARFLAAALARKAMRRIRHPSINLVTQWRLAIRPVPLSAGDLPVLTDPTGFRWIESPPERHWADPFLLEHGGRHWLFFEEYLYGEGRGVISVAPLGDDGGLGPVERILDTGGHLSYPFIFEDADGVYLMPESADQGATTLYRAVEFPHRWEKVAVLGEGLQLLDTTVLHHQGLYWFFTTVPGRHRSGHTLLLFYAEFLAGPWHPHPMSPISSDIRDARSAGAIVRADGRLFRPVQDGAGGYGQKLHFFEIRRLSVDEFYQELRGTVSPRTLPDAPRGLEGVHTYNRTGRFEVIDGKRLEHRSRHRGGPPGR